MSEFPCLFGRISLRRNGSDLALPAADSAELIFGEHGVVQVYSAGTPAILRRTENSRNVAILFGRLHAPIAVCEVDRKRDANSTALTDLSLSEIEGSFILLRIHRATDPASIELACDKYGTRRLLYHHSEDALYFSTHLSGLQKMLRRPTVTISEDALLHYYNFGFTSADQTLLSGVRKLPGGCSLKVEKNVCTTHRYFDLGSLYAPERYAQMNHDAICGEIDAALATGLRHRTPADKRVAIAMSGGVDSGYIAQKLVQIGAQATAYNISYGTFYDEDDRVDTLSKALELPVKKQCLAPKQIIENFEYVNARSSEPVGFNGTVMRFVAMGAKTDGHSTLFDGDGTDRLFLGMNRYLEYKKIITVYRVLRRLGLASLANAALRAAPNPEFFKLHLLFANWQMGIPAYPERQIGNMKQFDASYERHIFELAIKPYYDRYMTDIGLDDFGQYFTYQALQMCPEIFFHDATEIQTEVGIVPIAGFFSDAMVSLALSLPTDSKLRAGKTKWILRKAAALHTDERYWMLPKIGLQSAFAYVLQSEEGKRWHKRQRERVLDSPEFQRLRNLVPGGNVEPDRLTPLLTWKESLA